MSISFSSIKGYHNKVNLGDSGYNQPNFDKNTVYNGGNPNNWNSNHNIIKDSNKSIHTRHKQKVGTEIISNMNRNKQAFDDRITENISVYPKGKNLMTDGIDYGGTPYKIGDSSKTCKFNIGDYVRENDNYALSRRPIQNIPIWVNKNDRSVNESYINKTPNVTFNENYKQVDVHSNKYNEFYQNHSNLNSDRINRNALKDDKLHYNITYNTQKTNNFNDNHRTPQNMNMNENYTRVKVNTSKQQSNNSNVNHNYINTENYTNNDVRRSSVNTNIKRNFNELDVVRRPVTLENKMSVKESYNNNRVGIRSQTQNLNFRL